MKKTPNNLEDNLEQKLQAIAIRNNRVEDDKAWEVSWSRRLSIMVLTYLVVAFYLRFVVRIEPWINALVPVIGFLLSTLTMSILKQRWLKRRADRD